MIIHFDTKAIAEAKLDADGFTRIKNGVFVSRNKVVKASIHPVHGSDAVAVFYSEIEAPSVA